MPHASQPEDTGQPRTSERARTTSKGAASPSEPDSADAGKPHGTTGAGRPETIAADTGTNAHSTVSSATNDPETGEHDRSEPDADRHTAKDTEPKTTTAADTRASGDRRAVAIAATFLLASGSLIAYGILATDEEPEPPPIPTAEVTYEVQGTGEADITYRARSSTRAATATAVHLPWKKTVRVPLGHNPIVSITLGEKGGKATCTLTLRDQHVQSATAYGPFGRANCTGQLAAPETDPPHEGRSG
jgi:hypothetical protein